MTTLRFTCTALAAVALAPLALCAQTLPARPVPLEEPVRGGSWKNGELVLGKTTLAGARRMFVDAVKAGEPRRLPAEHAWEVGGVTLRPRWQFDPGEGFYQLYFDDNERLIYALDREMHTTVTRTDFLSRYPRALRAQQSGSLDQYQVDVQPCVTLTATVERSKDKVTGFGYAWTCRTAGLTPAASATGATGR
jgi:hypothetical protein